MIRITHFIPYIGSARGGPIHALRSQLMSQDPHLLDSSIYTIETAVDDPPLSFPESVSVESFPGHPAFGFRFSSTLAKHLSRLPQGMTDVVHSHLLWTHCHLLADQFARRQRVPHLISPCGTLASGALEHRSWKKKIILRAFQKAAIGRAHCLHAKSASEQLSIQKRFPRSEVALIPNSIEIPDTISEEACASYRKKYMYSGEERHILYLGRIHPVKNLDNLLRAWAQVSSRFPTWRLVFAGPDEDGHQLQLQQFAVELGIASTLRWTGNLPAKEKWAALKVAEILVLPSHFENFGLAAAEALAAGTPVMASTATPWKALADHDAGMWVDKQPDSMALALAQLCASSPEKLTEMGTRGREIALAFSPEKIQEEWVALYRWLTGCGERPACVFSPSGS